MWFFQKKDTSPPVSDDPGVEDARTKFAAQQVAMFQASADKIRQRADTTAKAIGGLGTTALTALGIARFADVFPSPETPSCWWWLALIVVVASFAALAWGVAFFTLRQWKLNQPITVTPYPEQMQALGAIDEEEMKEVDRLYRRAALLAGAESIAEYEARAERYARIATWAGAADAKRFAARAALVVAEVQAIEARARSMLARKRSTKAITDSDAKKMYALLAAAILGFGIGSDYLKGVREDEIATAKACADAQTAGVKSLPDICGNWTVTAKEEPTPAEKAAAAVASLGAALGQCEANVLEGKAPAVTCDPLRAAFHAAGG